jgi:hypothetical protein
MKTPSYEEYIKLVAEKERVEQYLKGLDRMINAFLYRYYEQTKNEVINFEEN